MEISSQMPIVNESLVLRSLGGTSRSNDCLASSKVCLLVGETCTFYSMVSSGQLSIFLHVCGPVHV